MTKSLEDQIKELEAKQEKVKAQLKQKKAEASKQKRQEDTRKKILIGSAILAKVKAGKWPEDKMIEMLSDYLEKDRDRELFGLNPLPANPPQDPEVSGPAKKEE